MKTERPVTVYSFRNEIQSDLRGLTAASLLAKIELAESGDTRELFALYRDLIASDSQLQMELENRKRAVLGDTSTLLPFDKAQPADLAAKELCWPLLDSGPFEAAKAWLLNAVLYPVAVCEKVYAPAADGYALAQIVPVPYQLLDYASGSLRVFDTDPATGRALPTSHAPDPARYIVHRGHALPLPDNWGGPMRSILFWILLRTMSRQWWADLLERFGQPFLKGKYSDDKGRQVLESAFRIAQRLGGIVVHKNTEVEIVQAAAGDSSGSHERFIELCNKEISKLVAGQTLSSNAQPTGLGNGATPLQGAVRDDIRKADAQRLAATLRSQLLAQYCAINGASGRVPNLVFGSDSAAETAATLSTIQALGAAGLEPDDDALATLGERLGFGLRRKASPSPSPALPGLFHALPLAAATAPADSPGIPRAVPEATAGNPSPEALADILSGIVSTSRSASECLRRLRAALVGRPLDDEAEALSSAMDAYARRALGIPAAALSAGGSGGAAPRPLSTDANGAHHGDHSGRFVSEGGENDGAGPAPAAKDASSSSSSAPAAKDAGKPDSSGYTEEQRKKVGQTGRWDTLGLPPLRDIPPDEPVAKTNVPDAIRRIRAGEMVTNPFGENLAVDQRAFDHLNKKGRDPKELHTRYQELDFAEETVRHPHEIWLDEKSGRRKYIRFTKTDKGHKVINAVDESGDHLFSWHSNGYKYDYYREGKLLYLRP